MDSLRIAKQLSNKELTGINVPNIKREQFRILTRTRNTLVETKKRIGNQLKSLLFTQGLIDPNDNMKVCKTWIKKIQQIQMSEELKYSVDLFINLWLDLEDKLHEMLKKLNEQAKIDSLDHIYRSAPGIGALSARILSNELEDMQQFQSAKKLFSYTGLTPSEHSSGEHKWLGSISRQGKPLLRMLLVQIAWRSIKQDKHLLEVFERISKTAGRKRAIVAVARKIIGCIRRCFITGELWCTNTSNSNDEKVTAEAC